MSIKRGNILIVEDDRNIREISAKLLSMSGYSTYEADNRDEAVQIMNEKNQIDTVLMDISMPGMTIDEFLAQVSSLDENIKVIFSSGQPEETIKRYLEGDCDYRFLSKPYGLDELYQVLDHTNCTKENVKVY